MSQTRAENLEGNVLEPSGLCRERPRWQQKNDRSASGVSGSWIRNQKKHHNLSLGTWFLIFFLNAWYFYCMCFCYTTCPPGLIAGQKGGLTHWRHSRYLLIDHLTLNIKARWLECFSAFQGGLAQAISIIAQPTLHTSQLLPYCWPLNTWGINKIKFNFSLFSTHQHNRHFRSMLN